MTLPFHFSERELSEEMSNQEDESSDSSDSESDTNESTPKTQRKINTSANKNGKNGKTRRESIWTTMLGSFFDKYPMLKSIDGRAATVHNFMRGLSLYKAYPFSPFTSVDQQRKQEDKLEGKKSYLNT